MRQSFVERMLYATLALVFLGVFILVMLERQSDAKQTASLNILQEQSAGQKKVNEGVQKLLARQGLTVEEMNKILGCFLVFFGTPNRTNLYISDYLTCTITNTSTGETQVLQIRPSVERPAPNPQPGMQQAEAPEEKPASPPDTPATPPTVPPPGATERLGSILNDTIDEVPKILNNVLQLIPKEKK